MSHNHNPFKDLSHPNRGLQLTYNLTFTHVLHRVNSLHSRQNNLFKLIKQILPSFYLKLSEGLITSTKNSSSLLWPSRHLEIWPLTTQCPLLWLCSPPATLALLF